MIEFLEKIQNRGMKIARVNSILITKSINLHLFTLILYGVGVHCDVDMWRWHVMLTCDVDIGLWWTDIALSIYREVYGTTGFTNIHSVTKCIKLIAIHISLTGK